MNKKVVSILKYVIGLGLGLGLLYLALREVDLNKVKDGFKEANYLWVALGLLFALLSHWLRAVRWKMLIKAAGYESNTFNLFASIMVGYMVNQAIPRAGEISRATFTSKTERIPMATSLGTMVTDRVFDVICLGLLILAVFALQYEQIQIIIDKAFAPDPNAVAAGDSSGGSLLIPILAGIFVLGAILVFVFRKKLAQISIIGKIFKFIGSLWDTVLSVRKMDKPLLFLFYTVGIWTCYVMMTWLVFFALDETSGLPFVFALTTFVMGGIGMVFPSPGGIGSYHFAVILSFVGYAAVLGWTEETARTIGTNVAFITHTSQLVMMILVGFLCYLFLVPKVKIQEDETNAETES